MRSLSRGSIALLAILSLAACGTGTTSARDKTVAGDAAGEEPDGGATACDNAATARSGTHNAGKPCGQCHGEFTVGGTLYKTASGGGAVGGAAIHVVDAAGKAIKLVTDRNGNFHSSSSLTYPLTVWASQCPSVTPMHDPVEEPGDCNDCHRAGDRIHLE